MTVISVVGQGRLGLPLSVALASAGYDVVGVDIDEEKISRVNNVNSIYAEPGVTELRREVAQRLVATSDLKFALSASRITFLIVPTPSDDNDQFSSHYVVEAIRSVGRAIRTSTQGHLVVVCSTVMPGTTDNVLKAALEYSSGKRLGADLGLCYFPEFVALGSVLHDLFYPKTVIIGSASDADADELMSVLKSFYKNEPDVQLLDFTGAELAKLLINNYIAMKIAFANYAGEMAEQLRLPNTRSLLSTIGSDPRIGKSFLRAGAPFGGPCFPRDVKALRSFAADQEMQTEIPTAIFDTNNRHFEQLYQAVTISTEKSAIIAILGLSFKTESSDLAGSVGLALAKRLHADGLRLTLYDRHVSREQLIANELEFTWAGSVEQAVSNADVVVLVTDDPEFYELPVANKDCRIVDPWRILTASNQYQLPQGD